jgi:hypothetical protein
MRTVPTGSGEGQPIGLWENETIDPDDPQSDEDKLPRSACERGDFLRQPISVHPVMFSGINSAVIDPKIG